MLRLLFLLLLLAFAAFRDLVDNPPPADERLRALLRTNAPWE